MAMAGHLLAVSGEMLHVWFALDVKFDDPSTS